MNTLYHYMNANEFVYVQMCFKCFSCNTNLDSTLGIICKIKGTYLTTMILL